MLLIPASVTLLSLTLGQPSSTDTVGPAQARQAVERSLPFLREEGIQWARKRNCISCHHVGFMAWSLSEAQRSGLAVDKAELRQWSDWAIKYATYNASFYQLNDKTFAALQKAGIAEDKITGLKSLKQLFVTRPDFRAGLAKALPAEMLGQHLEL